MREPFREDPELTVAVSMAHRCQRLLKLLRLKHATMVDQVIMFLFSHSVGFASITFFTVVKILSGSAVGHLPLVSPYQPPFHLYEQRV